MISYPATCVAGCEMIVFLADKRYEITLFVGENVLLNPSPVKQFRFQSLPNLPQAVTLPGKRHCDIPTVNHTMKNDQNQLT